MKRALSAQERVAQHQRKTLGVGRDPLAAPVPQMQQPNVMRISDQPPIANPGDMTAGRSTPWHVIRGGHSIVTVLTTTRTAPTGDSTFQWRVNGTLVGSVITWHAGDTTCVDIQAIDTAPHDVVDLECLTVGAGLGDVGGRGELNG